MLLRALSLCLSVYVLEREPFLPHTYVWLLRSALLSTLLPTLFAPFFVAFCIISTCISLSHFLLSFFFLLPSAMNLEVEHTTGRHFLFFCTSGTFIRQTSLIFQYCQFSLYLSLSHTPQLWSVKSLGNGHQSRLRLQRVKEDGGTAWREREKGQRS